MTEIEPIDHKAVRKALSQRDSLPTLPTTYTELIRAMGNPTVTILDLTGIITPDPVLTANVLRVANSSFFGLSEPVEDVSGAIFQLGIQEVGNIAMSVGYFDVFASKAKGISEDFLKGIWIHSSATALIGRKLAQEGKFPFEKDVYTWGLLHDVGKLFFATSYTSTYASLRVKVSRGEGEGLDLERQVFGITHLEAGVELCRYWKMPDRVLEVAMYHHEPSSATEEMLLGVECIATANVLAHKLANDEPTESREPQLSQWLTHLSEQALNPEQFTYEAMLPSLNAEVERAKEMISMTRRRRKTF